MLSKNQKISLIFNCIIFVLSFLGIIFIFTDFKFMNVPDVIDAPGIESLKFFTVQSNILVGIVALIIFIYLILLNSGKIKSIPKVLYILKFIACVAVGLTFLTVLFYLAPFNPSGFFILFANTNLLYHFIIPVLSLVSFIFFEKVDMNFKCTFLAVLPMILYGIFYIINLIVHMENGAVSMDYDWYGFAQNGVIGIIISPIVMLAFTYLIAYLTWFCNKKCAKND